MEEPVAGRWERKVYMIEDVLAFVHRFEGAIISVILFIMSILHGMYWKWRLEGDQYREESHAAHMKGGS